MSAEFLSEREYLVLARLNDLSDDRLAEVLGARGGDNLTVCPLCRIDDFTHVEGCELEGRFVELSHAANEDAVILPDTLR